MGAVVRIRALAAAALFFAAGWPSKSYRGPLEELIVGGLWDVCGSAFVFFLSRTILAKVPLRWLAGGVWAALITNELLQLAEGALLDSLRQTRVGAVILGSSFDPWDLLAISIGVSIAALVDHKLVSHR